MGEDNMVVFPRSCSWGCFRSIRPTGRTRFTWLARSRRCD